MQSISKRLVLAATFTLASFACTKAISKQKLREGTIVSGPYISSCSLLEIRKVIGDFQISNCAYTNLQPILSPRNRFPFVKSKASLGTIQPVDAFLAELNLPILGIDLGPRDIAAVSYLKIDTKWDRPGTAKDITLKSKQVVPGVSMFCTRYKSKNGPLFMLPAGDFQIFVTDRIKESDPESLFRRVSDTIKSRRKVDQEQIIEMPMIDLEKHQSSSPLANGILERKSDLPYRVTSATLLSTVRLDEIGASAEVLETITLTPFGISEIKPPNVYRVETDFVIWFEYENLPVFIAHIGTKAMKRPPRDS